MALAEHAELPARFEIVPQKLVYGGAALGHYNGRPVLVPYALPGERLEVEPLRQAKGMIHARLLRVLDASPDRVPAECPYFSKCGGCHYQQMDSSRQVERKREILQETLRRIGGIDWSGEISVHADGPWRYRNQVQLKVGRGESGDGAIGFFAADSHRLIPIESCMIASPRLNEVLSGLRRPEWTARLAGCSEIELLVDDYDDEVLLTLRGGDFSEAAEKLAADCRASIPGVVGVILDPGRRPPSGHQRQSGRALQSSSAGDVKAFGKPRLAYRVGDYRYEISAGSFFQASRFLLRDFAQAVASCDGTKREVALDLYAGVGLFTLPLARAFRQVVAVEAHAVAASDLARVARALGIANVRAVASRAAEFLRRYAQAAPDLVVLDPPRAGVEGETLRRLAGVGARRIHYASCQPPTLARDLAFLVRNGYQLRSVELFDFFPQTYHIEALAKLTRA